MGISQSLYAQQVSGIVTNAETGTPMIGVNILVEGTSRGTVTDANGHYSLNVSSMKDTLRFSFIGYKTREVPIKDRSTINVSLEPRIISGKQLVVIGYGKKQKSKITGAVSAIQGKSIEEAAAVNVANSLAGKVTGLYIKQNSAIPGFDEPKIVVRGFNTYRNSSALVVIDGVPQADPAGLSRLNPQNIQSISVLKGANAAIYGARSSGGVILVTTKSGSKGKPVFSYIGSYGIQIPTTKPKTANALQYMHIINSWRKLDGTTLDYNKEKIQAYKSGKLKSTDWWNAVIDPPLPVTRHSLSISGGTDKVKYYTAVGMVAQFGGLIEGDDKTQNRQYSLRSNLDFTISKRLAAQVNFSIREKDTKAPPFTPGGTIGYAVTASPLIPAFINGNHKYPASGFSQLNPLARITSPGFRHITHDVINVQFKGDYKIPGIDGLSLSGTASFIKNTNRNKNFRWLWNFYKQNKKGEVVQVQSRNPGHSQRLRLDHLRNRRITLSARLNYKTTLNNYNNINAFIEGVQMGYRSRSFWTARYFFATPLIPFLSAGTENKSRWGNSSTGTHAGRRSTLLHLIFGLTVHISFQRNQGGVFSREFLPVG